MQGRWEVDVLVTTTDLWSVYRIIHIILSGFSTYYLYVKILALGSVSLIFLSCECETGTKHWTIIVIENISNSCLRSSAVKSCVYPLSRLVSVLNDTHRLT